MILYELAIFRPIVAFKRPPDMYMNDVIHPIVSNMTLNIMEVKSLRLSKFFTQTFAYSPSSKSRD